MLSWVRKPAALAGALLLAAAAHAADWKYPARQVSVSTSNLTPISSSTTNSLVDSVAIGVSAQSLFNVIDLLWTNSTVVATNWLTTYMATNFYATTNWVHKQRYASLTNLTSFEASVIQWVQNQHYQQDYNAQGLYPVFIATVDAATYELAVTNGGSARVLILTNGAPQALEVHWDPVLWAPHYVSWAQNHLTLRRAGWYEVEAYGRCAGQNTAQKVNAAVWTPSSQTAGITATEVTNTLNRMPYMSSARGPSFDDLQWAAWNYTYVQSNVEQNCQVYLQGSGTATNFFLDRYTVVVLYAP